MTRRDVGSSAASSSTSSRRRHKSRQTSGRKRGRAKMEDKDQARSEVKSEPGSSMRSRKRVRDKEEPPLRTRRPVDAERALSSSVHSDGERRREPPGSFANRRPDGMPQPPKEEPNFEPTGVLALEDNSKCGTAFKFVDPIDAQMPTAMWRLYVFKKDVEKPRIAHLHRKKRYLFGKDRSIADIGTDHPSCSKQHAVLHHRRVADGTVKPYLMDLESVNGTFLNGKRLEAARYYEILEKDVVSFGMSSRDFIFLREDSANDIPIDPNMLDSPST